MGELIFITKERVGAPTNLRRSAQDSDSITLSWEAPANNDNTEIYGYKVEFKESSVNQWRLISETQETEIVIYYLIPGVAYNYKITTDTEFG